MDVIRTFTLTPQADLTHFCVEEDFTGFVARLAHGPPHDVRQELDDFVNAVKYRAELLDQVL
ncbi:hypothetical protein [Pseudarthrobacter sp. NIBRBAC000502770]|uniref:hypothetical protein n=1 Tax=Pseudarthrobacter sp. NIBRBAC000502770 TaxID=2590785 RepID=UPI0011407006|nr:hypothetical protein [Pseudarthrobacter sp. NIBRBAC000502770]QDG88133.1 hypothetical protein NIBR502770_06330 [Pseudarthrobacter sp. NIBRBAC000502770]